MKNFILPTLLATFISGCTTYNEDYIDTPVAEQKSDLRDFDYDGVINERDKCATTPRGALVDNKGCEETIEVAESMSLKVLFDNDSVSVSPLFGQQISNMAQFLKAYPATSIELQGYASKPGNPEYNLDLSRNRALMVQDEIIGFGIDPRRVEIVGFGALNAATEDTPLSQAQDRKVVATVVGYKGDILKEWSIFTKRQK